MFRAKNIKALLISLASLSLFSCSEKYDYTLYYEAASMKGTEVYCWQISPGIWRCGAIYGTNRLKTLDEILHMQNDLPCTLGKMKKIIKTFEYENKKDHVWAIDVPYPITQEVMEELYNDNSYKYYESENIKYLNWRLGIS